MKFKFLPENFSRSENAPPFETRKIRHFEVERIFLENKKMLDHFFCFNPLRLSVEAVFLLTQIPLNTKVLQISLTNAIPPENFTFSPFRTPSGTILGQFSEGEKSAAFCLLKLLVNTRHKALTNNFPDKRSRSSSYSHYLLPPKSNPLSF